MLGTNPMQMDSIQIKYLIQVTEQFLDFADSLFEKGDISEDEHNDMTIQKRKFLEDMRTRYV